MLKSLGRKLFQGWLVLVRRLLYLWVRTQVSGLQALQEADLGAAPVCFALERKSLSNLAILFEECARAGISSALYTPPGSGEQRSWFYLWPRKRIRDYPRRPLRNRYVERALQRLEDTGQDLNVVPVTIVWGRAPDRPESVFRRLTSDAWGIGGRFRQLLTILVHGRQTIVQFGAPQSLRALAGEASADEQVVITDLLRQFREARTAVVGPDLSHRRTLFEAILAAPGVRKAIEEEAVGSGHELSRTQEQAWRYVDEIASDFSWPVFQSLYVIIEWFWTRLYKGIEVYHIERAQSVAGAYSPVYVPCHRSHSDYLLTSYVLFNEGLQSPYKAAGINMNMPLVGPLLRRAGAFYLRRSFRDNPLYAAVFNEYVHQLFSRGFPIEYYVEGGRSRTGRTLQPRSGMLAMTVRSFLRDHDRPLVLIPVYAGYEKIIEEKTYLGELRGKQKQKESPLDVLRMLRNLRSQFGRVHMNVGQPIFLGEFLEAQHPGWAQEQYDEEARPDWLNPAVQMLAREVVTRINDAVVVCGINLVAVALLSKPRMAMEEEELLAQLSLYLRLLRAVPYSDSLVVPEGGAEHLLGEVEGLGLLDRIAHPMGDLLQLSGDNAVLMTYYRNNVLHLFVIPALIGAAFRLNEEVDEQALVDLCRALYPYLRAELHLRWADAELEGEVRAWLAACEDEGLLLRDQTVLRRPQRGSRETYRLLLFGGMIRQTLERFYIVIVLLRHAGEASISPDGLVERCQLVAQRLSVLYGFNAPEFFDKSLFRGFIDTLLELGVLECAENGRLQFLQPAEVALSYASLVLDDEVQANVELVARAHP